MKTGLYGVRHGFGLEILHSVNHKGAKLIRILILNPIMISNGKPRGANDKRTLVIFYKVKNKWG
jgi:hypothetical protein